MLEQNAPFFIIGCSRSGTTLLRLILAGHSRLCIPPETVFLIPLVRHFPLERPLTDSERHQALDMITRQPRWLDQRISTEQFRDEITRRSQVWLRDIVNAVYRGETERTGKPRWGDKTPYYIEIVPELLQLYPNARFVNLIRDGRDVAISYKAAGFRERWYEGETYDWTRAVRLAESYRALPIGSRILDVRYEDLVANLSETVHKVCLFLGEVFEPDMLDWKARIDASLPKRELWMQGSLRRDPRSNDIARWKRELNILEILALEAFLGDCLARLGYELRFKATIWKPALWLARLTMRCYRPLLKRSWRLRVGRVL